MISKKTKWLLLGSLIGIVLIFFLPLMPVKLWNMAYDSQSFHFFSGLSIWYLTKELFLIESIGALFGFLITFVCIGGSD